MKAKEAKKFERRIWNLQLGKFLLIKIVTFRKSSAIFVPFVDIMTRSVGASRKTQASLGLGELVERYLLEAKVLEEDMEKA